MERADRRGGLSVSSATLMLGAFVVEAVCGWPDWLHRRIRHPVVWIGSMISALEATLNLAHFPPAVRRALGTLTTLVVVTAATLTAYLLVVLLPETPVGFAVEVVAAASLLAGRSLYRHVLRVTRHLEHGALEEARQAVGRIVSRDPTELDTTGVARANLESLAENTSDGVIAPLFWGSLLGLPGLTAYKTINTLDSMLGYRTDHLWAFGGFAARLDDAANLLPARLTGGLIALASFRFAAVRVMLRDARNHRSFNAGWPESAMAGALDIRLGGPRVYAGSETAEPWLNAAAPDPGPSDTRRGLRLYVRTLLLATLLLLALVIGGA